MTSTHGTTNQRKAFSSTASDSDSRNTAYPVQPAAEFQVDAALAALPKADLHVHAEAGARLDRVLARRTGRDPYNWQNWVRQLLAETPPGMPRLARLDTALRAPDALDMKPENFVARVVDLLDEAAADGAILVEVRFGGMTIGYPDFMPLFREAERQVRQRYPGLRAEAIITLVARSPHERVARLLDACVQAARDGLAGVDFIPIPYDTEADWSNIYRWAERAAAAGLGIAAHAGEFSTANLTAALQVPGIRRIGHAVYAHGNVQMLEQLAYKNVTVECCLTSNVVLGATSSYGAHPIRELVAHGIPATVNTDDPVRVCTTIGREYAVAATLGFSPSELLAFTRGAVEASFTSEERRTALLVELQAFEHSLSW